MNWKCKVNLGDVNPIDHGGYFVFVSDNPAHRPEAALLQEPADDETDACGDWASDAQWKLYRFELERMKVVTEDDGGTTHQYLVPLDYDPKHGSASGYVPWFVDDLDQVASFIGSTTKDLKADLCSADPVDRAQAYRAVGDYWGFDSFDGYAVRLPHAEAVAWVNKHT